jgi:hypothetical protein
MIDETNVEFVGKMNPKKLTSLEEDFKKEQAEILADQAHWAKYGTNRSKKSTQGKREIAEELSRELFPREE